MPYKRRGEETVSPFLPAMMKGDTFFVVPPLYFGLTRVAAQPMAGIPLEKLLILLVSFLYYPQITFVRWEKCICEETL